MTTVPTTALARLRVARAALLDAARQILHQPATPDMHATLAAIAAKLDETAAVISDVEVMIEYRMERGEMTDTGRDQGPGRRNARPFPVQRRQTNDVSHR